jgi:hypothetical protein
MKNSSVKTITVIEVIEKRGRNHYKHDYKYPLLRLRGKWLREIGLGERATAYVTFVGNDSILISSTPPMSVSVNLTPLEEIQQSYKKLGIPTTRLPRNHYQTVEQ